ncbi:hypothetical protein SS50377_23722 [Spironucleus salmonicida]|uniref:Uncharacterized protein n=1 Tax=Spironucleus salmonicida TaxID=348837 RepID=V6LRT2_9EUKA|nr:hypothetical protein SS50377_23722 [Spironucleus salmonicida]|eukprot:EST46401.1 Hypothetical protein SS50377_13485 [Spironucleus salmonicida]
MLSLKKGRPKFKSSEKLSYAPDDIMDNIYLQNSTPFPESQPQRFRTIIPHPKQQNFTSKNVNYNAAHVNFKSQKIIFGEQINHHVRRAAMEFQKLQDSYKERNLTQKAAICYRENRKLSGQISSQFGVKMYQIDLPFIGINQVCSEVMSAFKQKEQIFK